jgi:hypothetical protein
MHVVKSVASGCKRCIEERGLSPVAGGGGNMKVMVNGGATGSFSYADKGSVCRAVNRCGRYGRNELLFPPLN